LNARLRTTPTLTSDAVFGSGSGSVVAHPDRTLLVVDDDPSVRHALWITFRELYQVKLADSGRKALDLFTDRPADVVVLDIRMPEMDGLEVLKKIKLLDPAAEVILLSAYESVEYVREALRLGASEYITKPYQVNGVRAAVETAMGHRAASRKTAAYDQHLARLQNEVHGQQMREELARTRNEIYASIIHDINGPLTVIAGYVELMQHTIAYGETLNEDQLGTVRQQAQSIARQVSNCIELSRRYLGFLEGKASAKSLVGIKEIFYDVAELLKAHPQARPNELIIHSCESDVTAVINNTDLLQILLNLTINALQCSPTVHRVELYAKVFPNGLKLDPGTAGAHLLRAPEFRDDLPLAALSVQDNGPGIPQHLLAKIFEPYFTTKPPGQGSGLGLAIVRRLILLANGAVHVYSHPGEGTVFTIYVPLHTTKAPVN